MHPDGVYTGTLCISSNDPALPLLEVPVVLQVAPCGLLELVIESQTIHGVQSFMACESIVVGPDTVVSTGADIDLTAPRVVFRSGTTVEPNASVRVTIPPAPP